MEDEAELIVNALVESNNIVLIPKDELEIGDEIGEGAQAKVYFGKYKDIEVAVKQIISIDWNNLANEIITISTLSHKFIPRFYGITYEKSDGFTALIFQFIKGTELSRLDPNKFTEDQKFKMVITLADVLTYMHENNFIHRDLKPENVMIDENSDAFLIDFGISKIISDKSYTMTRAKGSLNYMAPENLQCSANEYNENVATISTKVDVWSFGCLIAFLYTGLRPWANKYQDSRPVIMKLLLVQKSYPIPLVENQKIYQAMAAALKNDPKERATMSEILSILMA